MRVVLYLLIILISAVGCKKRLIHDKLLDGKWIAHSGSSSSSRTETLDGQQKKTSSQGTYSNDQMMIVDTRESGFIDTNFLDLSFNIEFDMDFSDYSMTRTETNHSYNVYTVYYYQKDTAGKYYYSGTLQATQIRQETSVETGTYTLTGDAGTELKRNSQIVLQQTNFSSEFYDQFVYKDENKIVSPIGKYTVEFDGTELIYTELIQENSGKYSDDGVRSSSKIWTVNMFNKNAMEVTYSDEHSYHDKVTNYTLDTEEIYSWGLIKEE